MSGTVVVKNPQGWPPRRPASITAHRDPAIFRRVSGTIKRTLQALAESIAAARRMARAYDELAAMSDPELGDMGIRRADIPAVVSGIYHRDARVIPLPASSGRRERSPSSNRRDQPCDQGATP